MSSLQASFSMLKNPAILQYLLKGVAFTLVISVVAVLIGLLLGSVLAVVRNYCTKGSARPFGYLATAYIELFRNTPLLLWIFICLVFCPIPEFLGKKMFGISAVEMKLLFKGSVALILFTSSVIAEIVRGGLNSVPSGQVEAGRSQGFHIVQIMIYIILPQAFHNIIPTLLSQVITTVKDSSYLANVAVIELMARTKQILAAAYQYNGTGTVNISDVFVLFGAACAIYFVINFSLSCVVRSLRRKEVVQIAAQKKAVAAVTADPKPQTLS